MVYYVDDLIAAKQLEDAWGAVGDHAARRADRVGAGHPELGDDPPDRRGRRCLWCSSMRASGRASDAAVAMELGHDGVR